MRIALLSPYSWTYPGGVTRHIEALAESFIEDGHHVRVLAPYDPPGPILGGASPRRAAAERSQPPDYLVSLGRTIGFKANGAVSNLSITPVSAWRPPSASCAPAATTWSTSTSRSPPIPPWVDHRLGCGLPLVGTFHTYNENRLSNGIATLLGARRMLNRLHVRIAVSEAAAWTARRFFGGHYRIIPNGVHLDPRPRRGLDAAAAAATRSGSCSSARRSSARGCRCCCARSRRCASTSRPS